MADESLTLATIFTQEGVEALGISLDFLRGKFEELSTAVRTVSDASKKVAKSMEGVTSSANNTTGAVDAEGDALLQSAGKATNKQKALSNLNKMSAEYGTVLLKLTAGLDEESLGHQDTEKAIVKSGEAVRQLEREYSNYIVQQRGVIQGSQEYNREMDAMKKSTDLATIATKMLTEEGFTPTTKSLSAYAITTDTATATMRDFNSVVDRSEESLTKKQQSLSRLNAISSEYGDLLVTLTKDLDDESLAHQDVEKAIVKSGDAVRQLQREYSDYLVNVRGVTKGSEEYNREMENLNKVVNNATVSTKTLNEQGFKPTSKSLAKMAADADGSSSSMRAFSEEINTVKKATKEAVPELERLSTRLHSLLEFYAISAAIAAFTAAIFKAISAIVDYDQALASMQAITGATEDQAWAMGETIKTVAAESSFATKEISQGLIFLGQAGLSAEQSMLAIEAATTLAMGTMEGMEATTDLLSTVLTAYNMNAVESARVTDVMATAINESKLSVEKLRVAFNYVAGAAYELDLSLEETAASLMVLSDNGIRASTMGTSLRQVLYQMIDPSAAFSNAVKEAGMELSDVNPKMVGYQTALENTSKILWDSTTNTVNMTKAVDMFGIRAAQTAAILVREYVSGEYQEVLNSLYKTGTASEMAAKQQEGLGVKAQIVANQFEVLAITLGEESGFTGVLKDMMDALADGIKWLTQFASTLEGRFTMAVVAATPIALAFGQAVYMLAPYFFKAMEAMAGWSTAMLFAETAMISIHGWVLIVAAAMGALAAIAVTLAGENEALAKSFTNTSAESMKAYTSLKAYESSVIAVSQSQDPNKQREWNALILRLSEEYKDLGSAADLSAMSTEQLLAKMKQVEVQKFSDSTRDLMASVQLLSEELFKSSEVLNLQNSMAGKSQQTFEQLIQTNPDLADTYNKLNGVVNQYINSIMKMVMNGDMSIEQAKVYLKALEGMSGGYVKTTGAVEALEAADKKWAESSKTTVSQVSQSINLLPPSYQSMYGKLDSLRQVDLANTLVSVDKQIKKWEESAKTILTTDEEMYKGKEAIRAQALMKFIEDAYKEVTTESEMASLKIDILNDYYNQSNAKRAEDRAKADSDYALGITTYDEYLNQLYLLEVENSGQLQEIGAATTDILIKEAQRRVTNYQQGVDQMIQYEAKAGQAEIANIQQRYEQELNMLAATNTQRLAEVQLYADKELTTEQDLLLRKTDIQNQYVADVAGLMTKQWEDEKKVYDEMYQDTVNHIDEKYTVVDDYTTDVRVLQESILSKTKVTNSDMVSNTKDTYNEMSSTALKSESEMVESLRKSNQEKTQAYNTYLNSVKQGYESLYQSITNLMNQELSKLNELTSNLSRLRGEMKDIDEQYYDDLKKFQQIGWTDTQKYNADVKEAHELMNKAKETGDNSYAEKAREIINELDQYITTKDGKMTAEGAQIRDEAMKMLEETRDIMRKNVDISISETERAIDATKAQIKSLEDQMKKISDEIRNISAEQMKINTTAAEQSISTVKTQLDDLNKYITETVFKLNISFTGTGSEELPISEKIDSLYKEFEELNKYITDTSDTKYVVNFVGSDGTTPLYDEIYDLDDILLTFYNDIEQFAGYEVRIETADTKIKLEEILDLFTKIAVEWKASLTITVTGLDELKEAYDYLVKMDGMHSDSYHTIHVKTVEENSAGGLAGRASALARMASGGKLPGYGGGDKIPAMLEPGEFVIRKEAVNKYGADFFDILNAMMLDMKKSGGHIPSKSFTLPPVMMSSGGSVAAPSMPMLSNELVTLNINVGEGKSTLYGEREQINSLVKNLRRSKLTSVGN